MRCDTCCRRISNPYAHYEYDCANWPEVTMDQISVDYLGYTVIDIDGDGWKHDIYRGDVKLGTTSTWAQAFMFIERQNDD